MKKIKMIFAACFIMGVLFYCPRFSVKAMAYETAWFPAPQMNLSQIAYETGSGSSHGDYNAIDILPGGRVFAPFTGVVVRQPDGYYLRPDRLARFLLEIEKGELHGAKDGEQGAGEDYPPR